MEWQSEGSSVDSRMTDIRKQPPAQETLNRLLKPFGLMVAVMPIPEKKKAA